MNVTRHAAVVKHDEDATYHKSGQPCVGKITIELTEDQLRTIDTTIGKRINECDYYINRYERQVGTQVLSHRQERAFLLRIREKLNAELVKL